MRIALGIVKLFPEGGLQRDCIRLARILVQRGHKVIIFTSEKTGSLTVPPCEMRMLPVYAFTNHGIDLEFATKFASATAYGFDRVVGFNKLLNLDYYYCGDLAVSERGRTAIERLLPRHRVQTMLEQEAFGPLQHTHILALTHASAETYRRAWGTDRDRITVLAPTIDPERQRPDLRTPEKRAEVRASLGIPNDTRIWLWVGAQAHVKGLDRVLTALKSESDTILLIVGIESIANEAVQVRQAIARRLDRRKVRFLGFREDIPELMAAADVLVHPSRLDVTGQAILEAVVNGLPAVVTANCGYAGHVEKAGAGVVLPVPFSQAALNAAMKRMRDPEVAAEMSQAGARYGRAISPMTGLEQAADVIAAAPVAPETGRPTPGPATYRHIPISLILTTYNRPDALDAVLRGLARQSDQHFEVVVADDGSTEETAELMKSWQARLRQPLIHVWHEHRGFRAGEIRNRGILASSGNYCIFLDGDCVPRNDFVQAHRELAEFGWLVVGNRVLMSEKLTDSILRRDLDPERWNFADIVQARRNRDINRIAPLLQARLGPMRKIRPKSWWGARSCNLAVWRSDLDQIDGFDSNYVGWGLEDSDLLIRLLRSGVNRKDGQFATGVFHLWHPLSDSSFLATNQRLLDSAQRSDRIRAIRGMSSLASGDEASPEPEEHRQPAPDRQIA